MLHDITPAVQQKMGVVVNGLVLKHQPGKHQQARQIMLSLLSQEM